MRIELMGSIKGIVTEDVLWDQTDADEKYKKKTSGSQSKIVSGQDNYDDSEEKKT